MAGADAAFQSDAGRPSNSRPSLQACSRGINSVTYQLVINLAWSARSWTKGGRAPSRCRGRCSLVLRRDGIEDRGRLLRSRELHGKTSEEARRPGCRIAASQTGKAHSCRGTPGHRAGDRPAASTAWRQPRTGKAMPCSICHSVVSAYIPQAICRLKKTVEEES